MSGKRAAATDLNHENWDREEEPEERGTFRNAPPSVLSNRIIKKACRKITTDASEPTKSVFSGFSGFTNQTPVVSSSETTSPFSFLKKIKPTSASENLATTTTGESVASSTVKPAFSFGASSSVPQVRKADSPQSNVLVTKEDDSKKSSTFYAQLKGLNQAVSEWIKMHVDKNPICLLTPIFKDYEMHFKIIEQEENAKNISTTKDIRLSSETANTNGNSVRNVIEKPPSTSAASTFSFGTSAQAATSSAASTFSFGSSAKAATSSAAGTFSFGTFPSKKPDTSENQKESPSKTAISTFSFSALPIAKQTITSSSNDGGTITAPTFSFGILPATKITTSGKTEQTPFSFGTAAKVTTSFDVGASNSDEKTKSNGLSFFVENKTKELPKEKPTTSGFSFVSDSKPSSSGFSFNPGATPFTFGNVQPHSVANTIAEEQEENEDEPPKVEFKQVVEKDAVYTIKCKIYLKKDTKFGGSVDGTLYLKPIAETGKTQMLVRTDTNLGNILVNMVLSNSIPVQRMGKNNVMLICLPTPESKQAVTVLLRPKTAEEADELFAAINKYKK